jgi:hypothetical protein
MSTFTTAPASNTRVVVDHDTYGQYIGQTGTVVEITPALAAIKSVDLTGTVWVYLDGQRDYDATSGYARSEPVGFDPSELAPAVTVGTPDLTTDTDLIEHAAKTAS